MARGGSKIVKGAYSPSAEFVSIYDDGAGTTYRQVNKITDYSVSDPDKVFAVDGTTPPIIECRKDATLGCDMVSLQAEGFDAATIAAFDALVASGTIPNLSVDKTDPAKPVIKFPAGHIKLTESVDGRGFCLTAGTGSDIVTVEVGAREISVKSTSGIDHTISHPDPDKTYNLDISKQLADDCFDPTKTNRAIRTSTGGVESPIAKVSDLSPELAVALAQTAVPASSSTHGSAKYGDLEFFTGYEIEGLDTTGNPVKNNIVLVKESIPGTPPTTKTYLLQGGKFQEVVSTTLAYGDKSLPVPSHDVGDLGVCFKLDTGKTVELPIKIPVSTTTGSYTRTHKNTKFLNDIIGFTQDPSTVTHDPLVNPTTSGAPAKYHGIEIGFDDGSTTTKLNSRVKFSVTDIDAPATGAPATPGTPPPAGPTTPSAPGSGSGSGSSGSTNVTTTKSISGLDKLVKSFGQLGLMAGFFLFVGAVLMPALLPAALGVLAAGAGLYLGSNLVSGNYDLTLNKIIGDQTAREAKREKDHKKFMKLDTKLEAVSSELETLEKEDLECQRLNRLQLGGPPLATELADLANLRALKASGTITAADQSKLDFLERLDRGLLSPTELADFNTLDAKRRAGTPLTPDETAKLTTLDRLKKNGTMTTAETSRLNALKATLSSGGTLTPAERAEFGVLKRLERGHLSTDEKNRLTALNSAGATRYSRITDLKASREKLENKNYLLLANADFKTILAIKSQIGAQAEKDEERKLRAAFDAAHTATPATEDEIKQFEQDLPTKKEAARVAAEKDFISKNESPITRNIMENARGKKTKQFMADLSADERALILTAADDLDAELKKAPGTRSAKICGPDIVHPTRTGRFSKFIHSAKDRKAKELSTKLSTAPSGTGPSYKTAWLKTFITRYEGYEKAKEALDAAGASDSKLKAWATARKIFNDEMGKSRDARILESTRASAAKKAQAQARIQKRRDDAGIDMTKYNNPEEYGR